MDAGEQKRFYHDRTFLKIVGVAAGVAVLFLIIFLPIYFTVIEPNNAVATTTYPQSTTIGPVENERFDCLPGKMDNTQDECENRGCTWSPTSTEGAPNCYFGGPSAYKLESGPTIDNKGITSVLNLRSEGVGNHFGGQFPKLNVKTIYVSGTTVRVKISPDPFDQRYEVPMDHPEPETVESSSAIYVAEHSISEDDKFGVKITRKETSTTIFDTSVGELMFADQFVQISTRVASEYIYGFGEHMHESFKHDMNWKTYGMFTYDQHVEPKYNLYGVQPYFMCMEGDGNAYGVFFVNSNAMEVQLQPTPAITYRTIGGLLDFYIFLGPTPEAVTQQYMNVIGNPYFPPYWSLGFQLCRWGYGSLANLSKVVNRTIESGIPYDVQYSDIDYMERQLDFTIDPYTYNGLTDFVLNLKKDHNMRYIIILDPAISGNETEPYPAFDNGIEDDIFIKFQNGDLAWGKVWPEIPNATVDEQDPRAHTAYPDFFHPNATKWWKKLIVDFRKQIEFDALWIDMNEPTSFTNGTTENSCPNSTYDQPPYYPNLVADNIYDLTICMQTLQYNPKTSKYTERYNLHSLYGWSEVEGTLEACRESTGERCLVLTRSTFAGAGKNAGHWLGDNKSNWKHMQASIIGMMEFSMFGFAYNGADVCGFFDDTTSELCLRWMQLGAFYPFYRNHNIKTAIDQDPAVFGDEFISNILGAMNTRYELLPYLYTLFYEAHTTGSTVVRPLMHQFPNDMNTYTVDTQFLWGPGLLITPVLVKGATSVKGYFPEGRWYNYYNGTEVNETGIEVDLPTAINEINVHVHGGYILPTQQSAKNTYYSRQQPLGLVVALDEDYKASGQLFWDDGNSIDTISKGNYTLISFNCESSMLNITVSKEAGEGVNVSGLYFGKISIFGTSGNVTDVTVAGSGPAARILGDVGSGDGLWEQENNAIIITNVELGLSEDHSISWS